jgi:uncharacterized protein YmfQ (DUF2313 family)
MSGKFSASQYSGAMRQLLPPGKAWNTEDGSVQASVCDALTLIYAQSDSDAIQLLADAFPGTANALLPEWNLTVGIPDPCLGVPASQAQNIQQLLAKFASGGGQSIDYLTALAASLSIDISIDEFSATHQALDAPAGMISIAADWNYTFRVTLLNISPGFINNINGLQCLFNKYKPAHTQLYFSASMMYGRIFR